MCSVSSSGVSSTDYAYDGLGRVTSSTQTTDGHAYGFTYEYNLADGLKEIHYPSGRSVSYGYDLAARVTEVSGTKGGQALHYTSADPDHKIQYAPHGAPAQLQLGNSLWETTQYNSRLQPSAIKLGTSAGSDGVFGSALGYETSGDNNGNVLSQTITGSGLSVTQNYTYDELNRLSGASEGSTWSRTFGYDAYGNMWLETKTALRRTVSRRDRVHGSSTINRTIRRIAW